MAATPSGVTSIRASVSARSVSSRRMALRTALAMKADALDDCSTRAATSSGRYTVIRLLIPESLAGSYPCHQYSHTSPRPRSTRPSAKTLSGRSSQGEKQEVRGSRGAHQRPAVADRGDHAVEPLQLQAVVQGVPEPVSPVHQRQGAH